MKKIEIKAVYNGYVVSSTDGNSHKEYVFRNVDEFIMLVSIAKELFGKKIEVIEK